MGLTGQEDASWAIALTTLVGPPWRGEADLIHLHHPPQPRRNRTSGTREGWALFKRYSKARGNPTAMRELLNDSLT